jgi:plastocyanin
MSWLANSLLMVALAAGVPAASADEVPFHAMLDTDGVQHVAIVGGSYFFRPNHIVVKANVPVEVSVRAEQGLIPHSFVLEAPQAGVAIRTELSTEPKKFLFTPTMPGRYPFYCAHKLLFFKSHRERGMEGTLEVVE